MAAACTSRLSSRAPAVASSSGRVSAAPCRAVAASRSRLVVRAHKVEIEHHGTVTTLEVPAGKSILEVALDKGMDLPHDCKLGVCMTCPAKLMSGNVDQSGSMLSDDVAEKGYALLCMAMPTSDCKIMTVSEDELLEEQLCA